MKFKIEYNGFIFTREEKSGYYKAYVNGERKFLHRYIYENEHKEDITNLDIHHIDFNKENNNIDNLIALNKKDHRKIHIFFRSEETLEKLRKNADIQRPKTKEWHGSEQGREWHLKHYEKNKDKLHIKQDYECLQCGSKFTTNKGNNKFCSNNCKSKYRRESGVDNEQRKCIICGNEFTTNKYSKTQYCSNKCIANGLPTKKANCIECGGEFETRNVNKKYCSTICQQRYRRNQKLDHVKRTCMVCGKEFECNKHEKTKTCSMKCAYKSRNS